MVALSSTEGMAVAQKPQPHLGVRHRLPQQMLVFHGVLRYHEYKYSMEVPDGNVGSP